MPFIIQIKIASNCFLTYPWTILFSESPLPWFQDVFSVSFGSSHQLFGQNLAWSFTARNLYQLQMTAALGTTHVLEVWSRSGGWSSFSTATFGATQWMSLESYGSGRLEHLSVLLLPHREWLHLLPHHCYDDGGFATADLVRVPQIACQGYEDIFPEG